MDKVVAVLSRHHPELGSLVEVAKLLRHVLGVETEEVERLQRIEAKVDRLLAKDYQAAMEQVESAAIPGITEQERRRRLDVARDRLVDAVSAAGADLISRCAAEVALASLHRLMGVDGEATYWAQRAYQTSVDAVARAVDETNHPTLGRLRINHRQLYRFLPNVYYFTLRNSRSDSIIKCNTLAQRSHDVRDLALYIGVPMENVKLWVVENQFSALSGDDLRWIPKAHS